jgi:histidinol-phosphate aminotransferase
LYENFIGSAKLGPDSFQRIRQVFLLEIDDLITNFFVGFFGTTLFEKGDPSKIYTEGYLCAQGHVFPPEFKLDSGKIRATNKFIVANLNEGILNIKGTSVKISEALVSMTPYQPGKPISETQREYGIQEVIKLASNENPLGISPSVKEALIGALNEIHRYPDASCFELLSSISKKFAIPRERIGVGNGSDELIDLIVRVYCDEGDAILTSEAGFVAYSVRAAASRVRVVRSKMTKDYRFDLTAMAEILRKDRLRERIKLVFIANPNNPTGTYNTQREVENFLNEFGNHPEIMIIFDQAYDEFVRARDFISVFQYLNKYSNLILLKTLSKSYGLAGLRVGVAFAPPEFIDIMNRVRTPFNVNELAQVAAVAALKDDDFVRRTCETTWHGLDYFYKELTRLGLPYVESQGNFVMFDTLRDVREVNESLLKRGIIMRPILNYGFKTQLRLSVGTEVENHKAIKALAEVIKEVPPIKEA